MPSSVCSLSASSESSSHHDGDDHQSHSQTDRRDRSNPAPPVLSVARDISPRLADAALAAKVDDRLVDLSYPLARRRARANRHEQGARVARPLSPLDRAPDGGSRDRVISRRPVRHRSGHRRGLLLRLRRRSSVCPRGSRAHRSDDARAGGAGSGLRTANVAARRSDRLFQASVASRSRCS